MYTYRIKSAETLGTFLLFIHQREQDTKTTSYEDAKKFAETGFQSQSDTNVHGSLLVAMQLLLHPSLLESSTPTPDAKLQALAATLRSSMRSNFHSFARCILGFKSSPSSYIQTTVIALIPVLAKFDLACGATENSKPMFTALCAECVEYLMRDCIDNPSSPHQKSAYNSLGELCFTLGSAGAIMPQLLDDIITKLFTFIAAPSSSSDAASNDAALQSLGMIFKAAAASESKKLFPQLEKLAGMAPFMFQGGLSRTLITTLEIICKIVEDLDSSLNLNDPAQDVSETPKKREKGGEMARSVIQSLLFREVDKILRAHANVTNVLSFRGGSPVSSPTSNRPRRNSNHPSSLSSSPSSSIFPGANLLPSSLINTLSSSLSLPSPKQHSPAIASSPFSLGATVASSEDSSLVALALETLQSFDFYTKHPGGRPLVLKTVREAVICCLDDEDRFIRKAATIACCKILDGSLDDAALFSAIRNSASTDAVVISVLERLLMVGVADENELIRVSVFSSITPRLDPYVAQSENLTCLLDAVNDESVEVCSAAMAVIARLAKHTPNVIMPQLRKILIQLLRQLEQNEDYRLRENSINRLRENSIILLTELIKGAQFLLKPYIDAILNPLLRQLDVDDVDAFAVAALGELSQVSPECIAPHTDVLLTKISSLILVKDAVKKQTMALKALGQIVSTTGCVIVPYLSHPELLDGIIAIIQTNDSVSAKLRCEATRAFGILGVADPAKLKAMHRRLLEMSQSHHTLAHHAAPHEESSPSSANPVSRESMDTISSIEDTDIRRFLSSLGANANNMLLSSNQQMTNHGHHQPHPHHHRPHNHHQKSRHNSAAHLHRLSTSNHHSHHHGHNSSWTYNTHKQSSHLIAYHQQDNNNNTTTNDDNPATPSSTSLDSIFNSPMKLEEYYPAITINSLVNVLRDSMLNSHHEQV